MMKKILPIILVFLVTAFIPLLSQDNSTEKEVFLFLDKYADALSKKDAEQAASLFLSDPFFKYVSDGFVTTKEDWVKLLSESLERMDYYSFKWTEKEIKPISKNSFVAICKANRSFRIKGGPMGTTKLIFTITLEQIKDKWFITSIHESHYNIENETSK